MGTGRFAQALGVDDGVDPSAATLELATRRGIRTKQGRGEALPYQDASFTGVLPALTLCFVDDPRQVLRECARVLKHGGHLVVGVVPWDSPWGRYYQRKGHEGHPFYAEAEFFAPDQVVQMAASGGFDLERTNCCLLSPPSEPLSRLSRRAIVKDAGFVAMRFLKRRSAPQVGPERNLS